MAIGDFVLDLAVLEEAAVLDTAYFGQSSLNAFMAAGRPVWTAVRERLQHLLDAHTPDLRDNAGLRDRAFVPMAEVAMHLPARIGDYTDFYSSKQHATNVGADVPRQGSGAAA